MQYWINHNGVQSGPVDLDGIKEMGLTSRAFVWHEGLADWVKITQVPELQGVYQVIEEPVTVGQPVPGAVEASTAAPKQPQAQYQPQPYTATETPAEPCPPTNLVWAIISTILCCLPAGIVAIFYSLKVSNKYREGDLEGAKRASETGAWWCIAAIILGILTMPLVTLIKTASLS